MSFDIIAAEDPRWTSTLSTSKAGIFYTNDYCRLHQEKDGSPAMLLYQDDLGVAFDVTFLKHISSLPFYEGIAGQFAHLPIDLANPVYNGPIVVSAEADHFELLRRYRSALNQFCADNHVVTEFIRFHPLYEETAALSGIEELLPVSDILYVDLREGYEAARQRYRKGHRSAAQKAAREGASWSFVEPDENHVATFMRLYEWTQQRNGTRSAYIQKQSFFRSMFDVLRGRALLAESYFQGNVVSSSIFLDDTTCLWYQYSGSDLELLRTDAHTYMLDRIAAWAAEREISYLVLGGGGDPHDPTDRIAKFKRGFSHLMGKVHQLRKVHHPATLEALLLAKAGYNRAHGQEVRSNWFPSYWLA
jgi:serine/alanine adding enzyme